MPWTSQVSLDTDKTDVGSASVTWTDPSLGDFTYTERVRLTTQNRDAFIARAIAARNAWAARRQQEVNYTTNLQTALTTADT